MKETAEEYTRRWVAWCEQTQPLILAGKVSFEDAMKQWYKQTAALWKQ